MTTIDCTGQSCPAPVIATKQALERTPDGVCITVDLGAPHENVTRFAHNRGYQVVEQLASDRVTLIISREGSIAAPTPSPASVETIGGDRVLLITSNTLGAGDPVLGSLLMKTFLTTLLETDQRPARILMLNSGVLLAVTDAETVEALVRLEQLGVELFACGVCLDFYGKKDALAVGKVTNMFSTAENLLTAASVISL